MSLSLDALLSGLIVNTFGWGVACWCVKRWADGVTRDIRDMAKQVNTVVSRSECQVIYNRVHARIDEGDAKHDDLAQRVARLEVVAGK